MSPYDRDEAGGAAPTDELTGTTVNLNATDTREQATQHLREALSVTEPTAKQFHIRQALQLLDIEER